MKWENILLLGGAALIGYFIIKNMSGKTGDLQTGTTTYWGGVDQGGSGAGSGGGPSSNKTAAAGANNYTGNVSAGVNASQITKQYAASYGPAIDNPASWTGTTYGAAGQPSITFAAKTIQRGGLGSAAVMASAPPRVAAKFKAGLIY